MTVREIKHPYGAHHYGRKQQLPCPLEHVGHGKPFFIRKKSADEEENRHMHIGDEFEQESRVDTTDAHGDDVAHDYHEYGNAFEQVEILYTFFFHKAIVSDSWGIWQGNDCGCDNCRQRSNGCRPMSAIASSGMKLSFCNVACR